MPAALIQLAYRQIIDALSSTVLEKRIFHDSYAEFILKIQAYNQEGKFKLYSDIVANDGRANSLHYKTGFAILHHLETLKGKIPGLYDTAGRMQVSFEVPEFKVLESSLEDKSLHKIAITYLTAPLLLIDRFGEYMLLAEGNEETELVNGVNTFTLRMQPDLSIINYKPVEERSEHKEAL
jgi:hypothetical protein